MATFIRDGWHILEPATPYIEGRSTHAICEHLEAVTAGDIIRLLINVPPGTMKSLAVNVFWPAWEWGPRALPHMRIISASHSEDLATRDTVKMRRLIESDWFQQRWPLKLQHDQNEKRSFENTSTGFRQSSAVKGMTGKRGHRTIWDDPHSIEKALSDKERAVAIRVFKETLPTRVIDPKTSAQVIVMQRIHEDDVSGHILSEELDYEHLMLPMRYDPARCCITSIGFMDWRTEPGELLFPERFPEEVLQRDEKLMGSLATAGQMQQAPAPREGAMFMWEKLEIVEATPTILRKVRYWDKAGTEGGGAWTAGILLGVGSDGLYYILDVVRGQWAAPTREKTIKQTAKMDGPTVDIWIEQEPGSGGKESAESTVLNLAGWNIRAERATGEKVVRAEPYSIQVEAGNVKILAGPWNKDFIEEHKTFPNGKYKDQIDATSGGFNKLARGSYDSDAWGDSS